MALEPGPMHVLHNYFSSKEEVLEEIKCLDLWPTTYVSERMVYIVGINKAANLFEALTMHEPGKKPKI